MESALPPALAARAAASLPNAVSRRKQKAVDALALAGASGAGAGQPFHGDGKWQAPDMCKPICHMCAVGMMDFLKLNCRATRLEGGSAACENRWPIHRRDQSTSDVASRFAST